MTMLWANKWHNEVLVCSWYTFEKCNPSFSLSHPLSLLTSTSIPSLLPPLQGTLVAKWEPNYRFDTMSATDTAAQASLCTGIVSVQYITRTTHTLTSILSLPFSLFISFFLSVCLFLILSLTHSVSRLAHQILTCMGMLNLGSFIHFISHPGKPVKFRPLTALSCSLRI